MSETAGAVVRDALTEITVQADEQSLPAAELSVGIRYLNRMMQSWAATGIQIGYTTVNSPNDVLTVPAGAIEGIVFNLAMRLASQYDMPVSPSLALAAKTGKRAVRTLGVKPAKSSFPANLPIGSGNEGVSGSYSGGQFFPDCCEDVNPCGVKTNNGDSNGL